MAHESFEDKEIARLLNSRFVPVKVDREERPEVDMVYMSVCQAMTGQGGWPLTIILAPDKKPFFAGTYLPKRSGYNRTGLWELLTGVAKLWSNDRDRLLHLCDEVLILTRDHKNKADGEEPSWDLIKKGFEELKSIFDHTHGGFGRAPKFPSPHNLLFLLALYAEKQETSALFMAEKTLFSMARGGIHDQIGGGFSRYSTDDQWLVPHFEKMLYDNALLALAYLELYRVTNRPYYKKIVQNILTYTERELTGSEGGFYCGQDADSQGVEGKYYVFSREELNAVFETAEELNDFCQWFGITRQGNFEGKNIPNLINNKAYQEGGSYMDALCKKVYEYRLNRAPLHTDDKILTSWNAMMILAHAKAGILLENEDYVKMAEKAQIFTEKFLTDKNGRLLVRYREGESAFLGNLDDYSFYCLALLSLYEVTFQIDYLKIAVLRADQMADLFWDSQNGGFFFYGNDAQGLIDRPKEIYDGAIPSGNSAAALALLALASLTADPKWEELAKRQLSFLAANTNTHPSSHCFSLTAFLRALGTDRKLVCVSRENEVPKKLRNYVQKQNPLNLAVLFKCPRNEKELSKIAPFTRGYEIPEQGSRYYLCENHTCGLPMAEPPAN